MLGYSAVESVFIRFTRESTLQRCVVYGFYEVKIFAGEEPELAVYPLVQRGVICNSLSHVALICCAAVEALCQIADTDAYVSSFPKKGISETRGVFDMLQEPDICAHEYVHLLLDVDPGLHLRGTISTTARIRLVGLTMNSLMASSS